MAESRGKRRSLMSIFLAMLLGSGLLCLLTALATAMFGAVQGEEFCPQTLAVRSFSYYEIPLVGIQVTAIDRINRSHSLLSRILANKQVTPATDPERWDLLEGRRGASRKLGNAGILWTYLNDGERLRTKAWWRSTQSTTWEQWSRRHPKLAGELWTRVIQAARLNEYTLAPELFALAKRESVSDSTNPAALARQLDTALHAGLLKRGQVHVDLKRYAAAEEVLTAAIGLADSRTARMLRATARDGLNRPDDAAADRAAAKQLPPQVELPEAGPAEAALPEAALPEAGVGPARADRAKPRGGQAEAE